MMNLIFYFVALALFMCVDSAEAAQGRASIHVTSQSKVSYFYRDRKYATFLKCWGGPDSFDVSTDPDTGLNGSNDASGSLEKTYRSPSKPGFKAFTPNTISWNSDLNNEGDFKIEFKQQIVRSQTTHIENACSNQSFHSKLDSIQNTIKAEAHFTVPDGVYVVRIKKDYERIEARTHSEMDARTFGMKSMEPDAKTTDSSDRLALTNGEYQYFFVKPGDEISMRLAWESTELNDAKVMASYQVRMMGTDGCGKHFGKLEAGEQRKMADWKSLLDPDSIATDPHAYIERVSCVRNKEYVNSLIYGQHGRQLVSQLSESLQELIDWGAASLAKGESPKFYNAIRSAAYMSLLEVARSLLVDLQAYCRVTNLDDLFGLPKGATVQVRGYVNAARIYGRLRYLLSVVPQSTMRSYVQVLDTFERRRQTYAVIDSSPEARKILKEYMDDLMEMNRRLFPVLQQWIKALPVTNAGGASRSQLSGLVEEARLATDDFLLHMRMSFLRFANRDSSLVESKALSRNLTSLETRMERILTILQADFDWFLDQGGRSEETSPFLKDLEILNYDMVQVLSKVLEKDYGDRLGLNGGKGFLDVRANQKLVERTKQCLRGTRE